MTNSQPKADDKRTDQRAHDENHAIPEIERRKRDAEFAIAAIGGVVLILTVFVGYVGSAKPETFWSLVALIIALVLVTLELSWVHLLSRSPDFELTRLVFLGTWIVFLAVAASYSAWTETNSMAVAISANPVVTPASPPTFQRIAPRAVAGATFSFGITTGLMMGPFGINGRIPFRLYEEYGRLFCDVEVFSIDTSEAIEIVHNVVRAIPDGWDTNSNDNGLEIVDRSLRPIFQMYYETPTNIRVQGLIFVPPRTLLLAKGDNLEIVTLATARPLTPEEIKGVNDAIEAHAPLRLFKYPSAVFPGVPN